MASIKNVTQAVEAAIEHELVVVQGFLGYVKGEIISDAAKIKELLESEWSAHFVKKPRTPADPAAS